MSIMNTQEGRRWIGSKLARYTISEKTWRSLVDQGLPVDLLAVSSVISTEAVKARLEVQAGIPMGGVMPSSNKRPRGRPKE